MMPAHDGHGVDEAGDPGGGRRAQQRARRRLRRRRARRARPSSRSSPRPSSRRRCPTRPSAARRGGGSARALAHAKIAAHVRVRLRGRVPQRRCCPWSTTSPQAARIDLSVGGIARSSAPSRRRSPPASAPSWRSRPCCPTTTSGSAERARRCDRWGSGSGPRPRGPDRLRELAHPGADRRLGQLRVAEQQRGRIAAASARYSPIVFSAIRRAGASRGSPARRTRRAARRSRAGRPRSRETVASGSSRRERVDERVAPRAVAARACGAGGGRARRGRGSPRSACCSMRAVPRSASSFSCVTASTRRRRQHEPAEPQRGRERLAHRAGVDDAVGVEALQRADGGAVVAVLGVVVVLDDDRVAGAQPGDAARCGARRRARRRSGAGGRA